jgi:hypothetical protein
MVISSISFQQGTPPSFNPPRTPDPVITPVAPMGGGTYQIGDPVMVGGQVSDFDNDVLTYGWYEGNTAFSCLGSVRAPANSLPGTPITLPLCNLPSLSLGSHTITLRVSDPINQPVSAEIQVNVVDTIAPILAPQADKTILWPPNHKMVGVSINAHATDNDGQPVNLSATVASNEPQNGLGDGDQSPDWTTPIVTGNLINLQLRAERSGSGDGRAYTVAILATDLSGNTSTASVAIIVPHDQSK